MSCRRMTVKDVMQTMRERVKRQLTAQERKLAQVTAQQTTAFICTTSPTKRGAARPSTLKGPPAKTKSARAAARRERKKQAAAAAAADDQRHMDYVRKLTREDPYADWPRPTKVASSPPAVRQHGKAPTAAAIAQRHREHVQQLIRDDPYAGPRRTKLSGAEEPASEAERKLLDFAWKMKRIPRKALRNDVYPDVTRAVVDQPKAKAAFKKAFPTASSSMVYQAINILQERLDDVCPNT